MKNQSFENLIRDGRESIKNHQIIEPTRNYDTFNNALFFNKKQFLNWLLDNYHVFGISKILKVSDFSPELIVETYDKTILKVAVEFSSLNYRLVNDYDIYDPKRADIIISFLQPHQGVNDSFIPIISLFKVKGLCRGTDRFEADSLELTEYFKEYMHTGVKHLYSEINRFK